MRLSTRHSETDVTKSRVKKAPNNPPTDGMKTYGRIEDVAARTSMTHWAVEEAIRSGDLAAIRPGKHYIISMTDADEWMAKLRRRDARKLFHNLAELNAWLKRHGHRPINPDNWTPPTDEETQRFFEGCVKDEDGNLICPDDDED